MHSPSLCDVWASSPDSFFFVEWMAVCHASPTRSHPPLSHQTHGLCPYKVSPPLSEKLRIWENGRGAKFRANDRDQRSEIHVPGNRRPASSGIHTSHRWFLSHPPGRWSLPPCWIQWRWFVPFMFLFHLQDFLWHSVFVNTPCLVAEKMEEKFEPNINVFCSLDCNGISLQWNWDSWNR